MKEFMMAALPWICVGIGIVLCVVNHFTLKKAKEDGKEHDNYMGIGIAVVPGGCPFYKSSGR